MSNPLRLIFSNYPDYLAALASLVDSGAFVTNELLTADNGGVTADQTDLTADATEYEV